MISLQIIFGFILFFFSVYVVFKLDKMSDQKTKHSSKQRSKWGPANKKRKTYAKQIST